MFRLIFKLINMYRVEVPAEAVDVAVPAERAVVLQRQQRAPCHEALPTVKR